MDMELEILVNSAEDFSMTAPLPRHWRWPARARALGLTALVLCLGSDLAGACAWLGAAAP